MKTRRSANGGQVMKPFPKHVQQQLRTFEALLEGLRDSHYPSINLNLPPPRGKRKIVDRMAAGAKACTARLLHELLWDPSIRAVGRGRPVSTWETLQGHFAPAWTTTRMSPVGMDTRLYKRLQRSGLLSGLERIRAPLAHVVMHHRFVPEGTAEETLWKMTERMDERFWQFWEALVNTGRVVGGFAIRHFDPVLFHNRRGILLHYHVAIHMKGAKKPSLGVLRDWAKTARRGEMTLRPFAEPRGGIDAHPWEIKNLLLYVGRTERVRGFRRAKFLTGLRHSKFVRFLFRDAKKRRQVLRNGLTTADQLGLMLAVACYPQQDPGLLHGWDGRTRSGAAFFRALRGDTYVGKTSVGKPQ